MLSLSDLSGLIGKVVDFEEPPYHHRGAGMRALVVKVGKDFKGTYIESDDGMVWYMGPDTKATVIEDFYHHEDMERWKKTIESS